MSFCSGADLLWTIVLTYCRDDAVPFLCVQGMASSLSSHSMANFVSLGYYDKLKIFVNFRSR